MDIFKIANKNLSDLQGYLSIEDAHAQKSLSSIVNICNSGEEIIGVYINNQDGEEDIIVILTSCIMVAKEAVWNRIEYLDMERCEMESSNGINNLIILKKNGLCQSILVNGVKDGKFLDIYGFDRFIKKILINIKLA